MTPNSFRAGRAYFSHQCNPRLRKHVAFHSARNLRNLRIVDTTHGGASVLAQARVLFGAATVRWNSSSSAVGSTPEVADVLKVSLRRAFRVTVALRTKDVPVWVLLPGETISNRSSDTCTLFGSKFAEEEVHVRQFVMHLALACTLRQR